MPIGVAGKTAIVTGAGRGIGKAVAEGFDASFLQADVRKKADMERMAEVCIERYGRIDILCLNAGIYPNALIADMTEALRVEVRAYALEALGCPDGVLVVDETGFVKKGRHSVGVAVAEDPRHRQRRVVV